MGRISHHLKGKDYKKTHQRKLDEQRVLYLERREKEIQEQQYLDEIERLSSPFKSDWRSEIDSDKMDEINEGMTTSSVFSTTLNPPDDTYNNPIVSTSSATLDYTAAISSSRREVTLGTFDLSSVDQMYLSATRSGSGAINGWMLYANDKLVISGPDGYYNIGSSDLALFKSGKVTLKVRQNTSPEYGEDATDSAVEGWTVSPMFFYRTVPTNVFVSLDSPEATNFIRTDPIMRGLSAEGRRKKLEDMLDAGDEYLLKQIGMQGSIARPADTFAQRDWTASAYGLPTDYKERLVKANAYLQKNVGSTPVSLGLYGGNNVADIRKQSLKTVGFTDRQIDAIEKNNLLQISKTSGVSKKSDSSKTAAPTTSNSSSTSGPYGLPADYKERLIKANAYYQKNVGSIPVSLGLHSGSSNYDRSEELRRKSFKEVGFTDAQIDTIERNNLLQTKFEPSKKMSGVKSSRPTYDPDYSWNRTNVNVDPETFQKLAAQQIAQSRQKQQQVSNNVATSKATSDKSGYMDIQVGDQRRSYDAAVNYTGADTGNIRSWDQAAGDEIAQVAATPKMPSHVRDSIMRQYGKPGYGPMTPEDQKNIINWQQKLKQADSSSQDTQIAQNTEPLKGQKTDVRYDPNMKMFVPRPSDKDSGTNVQDLIKLAKRNKKQTAMVAHYEPQGQVISEKKLKSPKQVLNNKIPGYYDGKPAPLGFPDNPPPEMVNGMHPDLVDGKNVANRFNRLDPQSAQAMPLTGNPHIDKKVLKARKQSK